jgi:hypothetical protein
MFQDDIHVPEGSFILTLGDSSQQVVVAERKVGFSI